MFLSNSDIKDLSKEILGKFFVEIISKKDKIEVREDIIYRDNSPIFFYKEIVNKADLKKDKLLIPHLKLLQVNNFLKKIVVDMPAVPYMIKGADVMRPGIKQIDDGVVKGEVVAIVDEMNKKAIAIGIAEFGFEEMRGMSKGMVVRNVHYVGDMFWSVI